MTARSKRRSAAELMAELEHDREYQRGAAERAAQLAERVAGFRAAEVPIVADLRLAGVEVSSVWDLVNTAEPYPSALPVLLEHLERGGYPDRVMEGLGRALAVKPAVVWWDRLCAVYRRSDGPEESEGLAVALAASATPAQLDSLIALIHEEARGESRVHLVRPILRVGGAKGRSVLELLRTDRVLGRETTAALDGLP